MQRPGAGVHLVCLRNNKAADVAESVKKNGRSAGQGGGRGGVCVCVLMEEYWGLLF